MNDLCGKTVYWWDGEYEGSCELADGHDGNHFDGLSYYDDDMNEQDGPGAAARVEHPTEEDHGAERAAHSDNWDWDIHGH